MDINQFNNGFELEADPINSQLDIHIRVQQRNRRQSVTTVEGLENINAEDERYLNRLVKIFRKTFSCSAAVKKNNSDNKGGKVIQLQGDQRIGIRNYLLENNLAREEEIKIHGF